MTLSWTLLRGSKSYRQAKHLTCSWKSFNSVIFDNDKLSHLLWVSTLQSQVFRNFIFVLFSPVQRHEKTKLMNKISKLWLTSIVANHGNRLRAVSLSTQG